MKTTPVLKYIFQSCLGYNNTVRLSIKGEMNKIIKKVLILNLSITLLAMILLSIEIKKNNQRTVETLKETESK